MTPDVMEANTLSIKFFIKRDRGQLLLHPIEQARILDGQRRLRGKRRQQIALFVAEQSRADAIVRIDHARHLIAHDQRHAQNAAQRVRHHALLRGKPRIGLRVRRGDRFAFRRHLLHDRAAHRKIGLGHHRPIDIARHAHFHLAGAFVLQHQETALRAGQLNDAIHDLVEHLFQFQRGVDGLAHFIQRVQRLPLMRQRVHRRLEARHQTLHLQQRLLSFQHIA